MEELPELPFEQVLSYLNLEDRLKARAVSRRWYHKFNSFKVNTLCYSRRRRDLIEEKNRWVSGAFAQNFITSTRFAPFFNTFGQTILSNLKHLRLCYLYLRKGDRKAFIRTLNSLSQLEQLDIIRAKFEQRSLMMEIWAALTQQDVFNLNLPKLTRLQLENLYGFEKLILKAPRLREVKILDCYRWGLKVEIVHGESVERLLVDGLEYTEVKNLKNLQYLYVKNFPWTDSIEGIDSTFLSSLQHLKEIHTNEPKDITKLFEQKQRYGRADLKIYLCGLLLNGPHDPAINTLRGSCPRYLTGESLACLAENPSKLADEIPFYRELDYSAIKKCVPGLEDDLLKRFTDLNEIKICWSVKDIEQFLNILKNGDNIVQLRFADVQPQDLYDRLPEHCAVQDLSIYNPPSDLAFLFRLKHLTDLYIPWPIESETVRRAFEELLHLSYFTFKHGQKSASIYYYYEDEIEVKVDGCELKTVSGLNAAIEFIFGNL